MDFELKGRVVLVTGAGSGIGQAIAHAFAEQGARVAVNDRTAAQCAQTIERLRAMRADCLAAPFDVSRLDEAAKGVAAIESHFGRLDVLVNNAAVMLANVPFVDTDPSACQEEIMVGLFGAMHCVRAAMPGMIARRTGKVVNIVSDAARVGQEKEVAYSSAKGGLIAFTKSLAREVGRHGVTVNAVSPAATDTPLRRESLARLASTLGEARVAEREEKIRRSYPMRRIGTTGDSANAVVFLASACADYITGQILSVNGGYAMPG